MRRHGLARLPRRPARCLRPWPSIAYQGAMADRICFQSCWRGNGGRGLARSRRRTQTTTCRARALQQRGCRRGDVEAAVTACPAPLFRRGRIQVEDVGVEGKTRLMAFPGSSSVLPDDFLARAVDYQDSLPQVVDHENVAGIGQFARNQAVVEHPLAAFRVVGHGGTCLARTRWCRATPGAEQTGGAATLPVSCTQKTIGGVSVVSHPPLTLSPRFPSQS